MIDEIQHLELKLAVYTPLAASSYIPLPRYLQLKHAVINIQNEDEKCFLWSVVAALHPATHNPHRVSNYRKFEDTLNLSGIDFPTPLSQVEKFERQNNISINVLGYEEEIFPLQISKIRSDKHINLLLISNDEDRHYCLIKNKSALLSSLSKHDGRSFICDYCLHRFSSLRTLDSHVDNCREHGPQKINMPSIEDKWLEFNKFQMQLPVPFTIYADFECILEKNATCLPNPSHSYTVPISNHIPCGYAYAIVGPDGKLVKNPVIYRGENAAENFLSSLLDEADKIRTILKTKIPMVFSEVDEENFKTATLCHICEKPLHKDRVRDHDHLTGHYRGAAHKKCNLNFKIASHIPVIIHNLRGYDSHIIIQALGKFKNRSFQCIPNNSEQFISFSVGPLRFIDSLQFLNASLDKLISNLNPDKATLTHTYFGDKSSLMIRKGCYPYEYMDSFERFLETKLPEKEKFYSSLTEEGISDDDYKHAGNVWNSFQLSNLGEYHDLYVCSDVLLLADVFENFRRISLQFYKIDPCHTYTAPGLAWQACLRMSHVRLELLTDIDMHLFIEKGIRGGIAMISNRYGKANNPYLEDYDPTLPSKYIMYLDANNLYGWAMSQSLPTHGFQWVDPSTDVLTIPDDSDEGYILEVNLSYPSDLHNLHNEYPLAPEKFIVAPDMLSEYNQNLAKSLQFKPLPTSKLIPNLHDKKNYVLHYRNLKQYIAKGMKIEKVHRVLKFSQSPWLKSYIDFNTEQRKIAKSPFEKDLFKLLNNAVFGKTMENLRNRCVIDLITEEKRAKKLVASPSFRSFKIIAENLVSVERTKTSLLLNRPIYVGFSILDLSKTLMYNFHYDYIKNKYNSQAKLLFTDTDSLCYEITTEDVYRDMLEDSNLFDTSDYPKDHTLYSDNNKKVLGKMKDELAGEVASEFIGLKPKMYSICYSTMEKKTAKGVAKNIIKRKLTHNNYKTCLFECQRGIESAIKIASTNHKLTTVRYNKSTLCPFDNKRYILKDGQSSYAYGHYKIKEIPLSSNI